MANDGAPDNNQEPIPAAEEKPAQAKEHSPVREPKMMTISDIEYEQLKKDASEYKDKYLRAIADSENLRKRLHKERHDLTQIAVQSIIVDFLNPIDHMENALAFTGNMSNEVKNWAAGFKMILNQFKDVLAANDVHPFKSVGMPFDPHNHEAVEMVESDEYPPGTVIEESIRGYKMGSKTIRPARVKVAKKTSAKPTETENSEKKPETETKS